MCSGDTHSEPIDTMTETETLGARALELILIDGYDLHTAAQALGLTSSQLNGALLVCRRYLQQEATTTNMSRKPKQPPDAAALQARLLLTINEAAALLSIGERTMRRLITPSSAKPARIPTVREGGLIRIRRSDLDDYVKRLGADGSK